MLWLLGPGIWSILGCCACRVLLTSPRFFCLGTKFCQTNLMIGFDLLKILLFQEGGILLNRFSLHSAQGFPFCLAVSKLKYWKEMCIPQLFNGSDGKFCQLYTIFVVLLISNLTFVIQVWGCLKDYFNKAEMARVSQVEHVASSEVRCS